MKRGRNQRRRQGMNINRALDSNGPDVRIRGTANQIYDKYLALARDATSSGDRVKAENYLQHAEHYFRLIRSIQPSMPVNQDQMDGDGDQPSIGEGQGHQRRAEQPSADDRDDDEGDAGEGGAQQNNGGFAEAGQPRREPRPNNNQGGHNGPRGDHPRAEGEGDPRRRRRRPRRPQQDGEGGEEREVETVADAAE